MGGWSCGLGVVVSENPFHQHILVMPRVASYNMLITNRISVDNFFDSPLFPAHVNGIIESR